MLVLLAIITCIVSIPTLQARSAGGGGGRGSSSVRSSGGSSTKSTDDYEYIIDIWIEYNWINDTISNYTMKYSSIWDGIKEFLERAEFHHEDINDETSNKHDLIYVAETNYTDTLHMTIDIESEKYDKDEDAAEKLENYVKGDLNDDIINKYNQTELSEGLLNIIVVRCDISKPPGDWILMIVMFSIFGSIFLVAGCALCVDKIMDLECIKAIKEKFVKAKKANETKKQTTNVIMTSV